MASRSGNLAEHVLQITILLYSFETVKRIHTGNSMSDFLVFIALLALPMCSMLISEAVLLCGVKKKGSLIAKW